MTPRSTSARFPDFPAVLIAATRSDNSPIRSSAGRRDRCRQTAAAAGQANFTEVEIGHTTDRAPCPRTHGPKRQPTRRLSPARGPDRGRYPKSAWICSGCRATRSTRSAAASTICNEAGPIPTLQVFHLSILPGTVRPGAAQLGLASPALAAYYVLKTPTLDLLLAVDADGRGPGAFGVEFDPFPPLDSGCPAGVVPRPGRTSLGRCLNLDLRRKEGSRSRAAASSRNAAKPSRSRLLRGFDFKARSAGRWQSGRTRRCKGRPPAHDVASGARANW